jgi:hypothetical protein
MFDSPLPLLLDATHPIFNTNASYVCVRKHTHTQSPSVSHCFVAFY